MNSKKSSDLEALLECAGVVVSGSECAELFSLLASRADWTGLKGPADAATWRDLGDALAALKRHKEAIACYDRALALVPDRAGLWRRRQTAFRSLGENHGVEDIAAHPASADAWAMRAGALSLAGHLAEAAEASERALTLDPSHPAAARMAIQCRLHGCDWRQREQDRRRLSAAVRAGAFGIGMMDHRNLCDSEEELRLGAELVARNVPRFAEPLWRGERYRHEKIRIAYLSSDFRSHVVASVIVGCFEHHDRTKFETIGVALGSDDASHLRRRIQGAFDHFLDGWSLSDAEVAARLRALEVDIAIDLNGYSGGIRPGIPARRPAPVQVNYLGYAGTMAVPFMDYIVADRVVIPEAQRVHYTEQIVYLPHTYMPTDSDRPAPASTPTRAEAGLPDRGFVFTCQNAAHKFGPEMFDVWMRLLRGVEGSVLWLRATNDAAVSRLRSEARARGVAPERLLFAPHAPRWEDHLARLRLAQLFLDTLPYNAHATACDALWEGVPVLTCLGNSWPGRVGASLLYAIGLPELVTHSLAEYEALALQLARDKDRLAAVGAKLRRNRDCEPLFDTARFTRDLETAYATMWERAQAGLPPASFAVPDQPDPHKARCDYVA